MEVLLVMNLILGARERRLKLVGCRAVAREIEGAVAVVSQIPTEQQNQAEIQYSYRGSSVCSRSDDLYNLCRASRTGVALRTACCMTRSVR